ncbi:TlpA family protein disulfide reductase [Desulfolithobacter sp.]
MRTRHIPFFLLCFLLLPLTASGAMKVGDTIAPFAGIDMNGRQVDLGQVIGKAPIMLIFWASWCPNCKREVPRVNELQEKYGARGMYFLGINVGFNDSPERARAFMESTGMNYPVLFDKQGTISRQYGVQGVPTIIVTDRSGRVVFKNFGVPEITDENFEQLSR